MCFLNMLVCVFVNGNLFGCDRIVHPAEITSNVELVFNSR